MADKKIVFVAFAIEDERQRDFLKGQSLLTKSPFEYIDLSVKERYGGQRPVFKTNVKSFVSLRKVPPPIELAHLQRITEFFPRRGFEFRLDPSFEPREEGKPRGATAADPANTAKFAIVQKFNRVNLVVPIDAPHMWDAAIESKSCKLTVLGEHYRRLVERGRI
jgi:hypothetical protein